ncbi:hypothetical protein LWM68_44660 [Niabella sp. W65]|nr:hypothetical protein [Niabella sp. W65]MCH7369200.1 hypothetical protein [Niabella sp. W65]
MKDIFPIAFLFVRNETYQKTEKERYNGKENKQRFNDASANLPGRWIIAPQISYAFPNGSYLVNNNSHHKTAKN